MYSACLLFVHKQTNYIVPTLAMSLFVIKLLCVGVGHWNTRTYPGKLLLSLIKRQTADGVFM